MKKVILFLAVFCAGLFVWAETQINFHLSFGWVETVNISEIDTIRFVGKEVRTEGEYVKNFSRDILDSITFTLADPIMEEDEDGTDNDSN